MILSTTARTQIFEITYYNEMKHGKFSASKFFSPRGRVDFDVIFLFPFCNAFVTMQYCSPLHFWVSVVNQTENTVNICYIVHKDPNFALKFKLKFY